MMTKEELAQLESLDDEDLDMETDEEDEIDNEGGIDEKESVNDEENELNDVLAQGNGEEGGGRGTRRNEMNEKEKTEMEYGALLNSTLQQTNMLGQSHHIGEALA